MYAVGVAFAAYCEQPDGPTGLAGLAGLAAELTHDVPSCRSPAPSRPVPDARSTTAQNVAWSELQAWRKRARQGRWIDIHILSRVILANTRVPFAKDDPDLIDPDTGGE